MMAQLCRIFPKAQLVVTGPIGPHNPANTAYMQKLLSLRSELFMEKSVHFLAKNISGFIPNNVISDLYHFSDGLFFPSREEGFGIPLIEAAFSKIPVFCANIPVLQELEEKTSAFLIQTRIHYLLHHR